ncbi:MAG: exodeoxyribonuclease VII large subunit [Selenomonadaceae bacterium]|nr:exodeoxyribonuclease VII large subunit [Selenomonadaceae bacterium]
MNVHSVSSLNAYIKGLFARETVLQHILVRGEVSNFKRYMSGHCYFTLKDAKSALKCVMFRSYASRLRFQPENGMQIVVEGRIAVYERDGVYQLYAENLQPEGAGSLAIAFEQLKQKLSAEGLFDAAHKKPLPKFPKKIGIVTSLSGAVLRDIYHVSKRRWPSVELVLYPVTVQGGESASEIAAGIRFFNEKHPVDVLIVGRGGGSMEDLWSFNEEVVVRAIYNSVIPVISAVGHETDFTLADFAADKRAATPSQAAEFAVPDRQELRRYVESLRARLGTLARREVQTRRLRVEGLLQSTALSKPQLLLAGRKQRLDRAQARLLELCQKSLTTKKQALTTAMEKLEILSPVHVLRRGYSIVEKQGRPITSVQQVTAGDALTLVMKDGRITAIAKE